jgi:hypothetical protein
MEIIKSFKLFGFKLNENVYKPYVTSLKNLESYKKFSEWAEVNMEQSMDGKITKLTIYPKDDSENVLKYEIREITESLESGRRKLSIYVFKNFGWEYVMGFWLLNISDYENLFTSIEKMALKELYDFDITPRNFLSTPENLEPIEGSGNPDLMASLISRIPEWKVIRYFKENPMSIYMLDDCPVVKKKIMDKIGMDKDYSKIGRALKNGII